MNREQIKEKMISAMDLPKDVIQNASVITILGRNELCIENYRGIIEYTDTLIRVQTRAGQIRIQGKRLRIQYYTNDEMKVSGTLSSLEFTEGRNPTSKYIVSITTPLFSFFILCLFYFK